MRYREPTEEERISLELRWYRGDMLAYVDWVLAFADRHRAEILAAAGGDAEPAALLAQTKHQITQVGSLHLAAELSDQRREMENELWYCGERGEHDRATIQLRWCARHAAAWRAWRIQEYLFVAERCQSAIVHLLRTDLPPSSTSPAPREFAAGHVRPECVT